MNKKQRKMDSNKTNNKKRAGDFIIGCLCAGTGIVLAAMAKKYLGRAINGTV